VVFDMSYFDGIGVLLGKEPARPKEKTDAAEVLYARKRGKGREIMQLIEELSEHGRGHTWRNRRWMVLIGINLMFALSFWFDVQLVEGSLTASRVLGFHFADPYSSLLVMLTQKHVAVNLAIGAVTVLLMWGLLGGRGYCSWVCPYHLVAEFAEKLHVKLASRGIVRDHVFFTAAFAPCSG